ncbi:phage head-tail adapter protein [Bacillus paranthracis]|uniref:phage head-tail adapter protein n=1 Tax=Bacillus TaxID=1386 RepID=UPI001262874D|nr:MULTISPECIES: phage head-tail adapter protein [Bacillus]KAB7640574.1 phage head-tail adapter protein [Bacillus sp. B4-WWTP-NA-D-NA-NA]MDG1588798.1 phage head-tail adapter protein [Bacillus cereus]HDR7220375.1 phage head-tail adapter protein [Bacillus cereus]
MAIERHRKTYNDGIASVMEKKTIRNSAKKIIGYDNVEIIKLRFSELSCREVDIQLVQSFGKQLDMKIETLFAPILKNKDVDNLTVKLRNVSYSVIKADRSKNNMYLYLQKVGGLDDTERTD